MGNESSWNVDSPRYPVFYLTLSDGRERASWISKKIAKKIGVHRRWAWSLKGETIPAPRLPFFWPKKKSLFKKAVTFRNFDIFPWDFLKTISTRSENSISEVTEIRSVTRKTLRVIKVSDKKWKIRFWWNFDQIASKKHQKQTEKIVFDEILIKFELTKLRNCLHTL